MDTFLGFLVLLISIGAGFVQRVSGFGLGIFAMIFLPHVMPTHTAAATLSSIMSCATTTSNSIRYRKDIQYKTALPMIGAALITIPIAVYFSGKVSDDLFKVLLGAVLIVLSLYFLFVNQRIRMKPTAANGAIAGGLGGTLGGLFSTGGPPVVLYLTNALEDKNAYFATIQFYFCFTNLYATGTRFLGGMVTTAVLIYSTVGIVGSLMGDLIGKLVFDKLDGGKLKRVIYVGMILSGLLMVFRI